MAKERLEEVLKRKVEPLLEESMHKILGVTISEFGKDISDNIEKNPLIAYDIDTSLGFKSAKKLFKKQFLTRMLQTHFGNISAVAKITGLDRRSIHRSVKELNIGIKGIRRDMIKADYYRREAVGGILKDTLNSYKSVIRPGKLEDMYENVDELSSDIVKELPTIEMSWDSAERMFEIAYLEKALKESKGNVSKAARKIGIRYETLHRKLKKLGLK
ncbi:MAG: helix-turn-helix domain-containing protein [Candidatus Woesearchaeota archaeon]